MTTIYRVEKFIPSNCPKCSQAFRDPCHDFTLLLGDIVDGQKQYRFNALHDVIICSGCQNATARVIIEEATVRDLEEAERLLEHDGFTSIQEGLAEGNFEPHLGRNLRLLGLAMLEHPSLVPTRII